MIGLDVASTAPITGTDGTYALARLLVSCWTLSGDDRTIPTSHGLLDRALRAAIKEGAWPDWARSQLHFVDSRVGWQCVELPSILLWAQRAELTTAPNPSYRYTETQIGRRFAERIARRLDVSVEDARRWGTMLREATERETGGREACLDFEIEDY